MNEFDQWDYLVPNCTPVESAVLLVITDYDKMVLDEWKYGKTNNDYSAIAHNILINAYRFYADKYEVAV